MWRPQDPGQPDSGAAILAGAHLDWIAGEITVHMLFAEASPLPVIASRNPLRGKLVEGRSLTRLCEARPKGATWQSLTPKDFVNIEFESVLNSEAWQTQTWKEAGFGGEI